MLQLAEAWQARLAKTAFLAKPILDDGRVVWGRGTVLLKSPAPAALDVGRVDDRLSALLAVAGGAAPSDGLLLLFKTVVADWRQGERALAAIRLAFAPVARLDDDHACRLFLAEQALDAGLDAATVLREFGLGDAAGHYRKYSPDQPRVPAGSGRTSGQFGSNSASTVSIDNAGDKPQSASTSGEDKATIQPAFFDPNHPDASAPRPDAPTFETPPRFGTPKKDDGILNPLPLLLPLFLLTQTKTKDEEGPACPAMLPDRSTRPDKAGDAEEARVALLVNPEAPTPKRVPGVTGVAAMAYYLATLSHTGKVEYDDCKRSASPSPNLGLKKGDMVEVKSIGAARLIWEDFARDTARADFENQISRQITGIRMEGRKRQLFVCVGSQENVDHLDAMYHGRYDELHFSACQ